jgi:hypothetical protein
VARDVAGSRWPVRIGYGHYDWCLIFQAVKPSQLLIVLCITVNMYHLYTIYGNTVHTTLARAPSAG